MTNKEQVIRNICLSFDFLRQIIKNPKILESIKDDSYIEFIEKDFSKKEIKSKKENKKYFKVKPVFEEIVVK